VARLSGAPLKFVIDRSYRRFSKEKAEHHAAEIVQAAEHAGITRFEGSVRRLGSALLEITIEPAEHGTEVSHRAIARWLYEL
jgi:hypothetical protein